MKKNNKTYLLLTLVMAIWGILGFKIVGAFSPDKPELADTQLKTDFVPKATKARDTFSILADYRDPFLGGIHKPKKTKQLNKTVARPANTAPQTPVEYSGLVSDASNGQKIFFITISGQQQMLAQGEKLLGIHLLSGDEEKIRIKENGKTRTIPISL